MAEARSRLILPVTGAFSLAASARFLEGFAPAAHDGSENGHLHLAFPVEGDWAPVGVCVQQPEPDADVSADLYSPADVDSAAAREQLARILSLDIDGSAFGAVGQRDPVIGDLQAKTPGFRPVCFFSAYEAACWAIISHRIRITQAATIKNAIARRFGTTVDIHGEAESSFPAPQRLLESVDQLDHLWGTKRERLATLTEATLAGHLDAGRLRSMTSGDARENLQQLPGIGAFSAELILLRGAGHPDHLPTHERRLLQAVGQLYDIDSPTIEDLHRISETWRPYRTWCAVLVRSWYEHRAPR